MRLTISLLCIALSTPLLAQDVSIVGTIEKTIHIPQNRATRSLDAPATRSIKLLKIALSESGKKAITQRIASINQGSKAGSIDTSLPSKVELGMNQVPVLDQGSFGTCVTFSNIAALDAALNKGDYISPLCTLQLGKYLETYSYEPSGWDGSIGPIVLNQLSTFGIVNKDYQKNSGCGGATAYPRTQAEMPSGSMSVEQFHEASENINNKIGWSPILDMYAQLNNVNENTIIHNVKVALNQKDRVTFGVLLLDFDLGVMGAVGKHGSSYDSWVLTPEINQDIYLHPDFGGHEMVITGYDDNAIAIDDHGREHKGLFTLRNSWGANVGDRGNFYMSYDYFKVLAVEAQRIHSMPADGGFDSVTG